MSPQRYAALALPILILLLHTWFSGNDVGQPDPKIANELRGAWITTVVNLDWPSNRNLSVVEQKEELIVMLDDLKSAGFNAVFFQVRSEADAMYPSPYEPWSYWLTGTQGKAPEPFYDPLRFVITEGHKRGMEVHAWLNPYRAHRNSDTYPTYETHVSQIKPDWILKFPSGNGTYLMLNPGVPAVNDFISNIVVDLVRRYDLDGIHFDDYFYPYTPAITTEDMAHFNANNRGFDDIKDWRRDNIDRMVAQVNDSIQSVDPLVKFGISPFGIRKNTDANTRGGEGYHLIYANPLQWLEEGTIDYITPQLYWERSHEVAPYEPLMNWWAEAVSANNRHIYIGLAPYRLLDPFDWAEDEVVSQLALNRNNEHHVQGSIFFRAQHIVGNPKGLRDSLVTNHFKHPVLTPKMDWKGMETPNPVEDMRYVKGNNGQISIHWSANESVRRYAVYRYPEFTSPDDMIGESNPVNRVAVTGETSFVDTISNGSSYFYAVTAVGRNSEESVPRVLHVR